MKINANELKSKQNTDMMSQSVKCKCNTLALVK